ncbi:hypothetical protein [Fluviicola taffensis]|uniref:Uncharacterized protein n=1 Tax=Fluviicola taffensis (strain DSM 16823 / NCIMB 13979 / RW262) TaxID=755732 RepID=F2IIV4_FLUTR|nr:hypothetical protein [Fluviicola taffensis]AEA42811.1 hypothetical protein Fluta_0808 [Fluviicola taffensis DSM 16823]
MNSEKVIEKARELIENGKQDFTNKTNYEKYRWFDNEYYVSYFDAINLLLENGFVKNIDTKIQNAYFDIIPEPEIFTKNKEQFDDLYSQDEALRISSAKHFSKLARDEGSVFRGMLFRYPKTFELLFPALKDENLKIVRDVIITLGSAYDRYFKDPRVETELYKFYNHKDKELLTFAIIWTSGIEKDNKFDYIFPLLESKQTSKILEALCLHFRDVTKTDLNKKALPILIEYLGRKLTASTKNRIVRTIIGILADDTIEIFNGKINLKNNSELSNLFKECINLYCSKERIEYLTAKIL